jgi:tetratricopeptide (TPR) repeat protein
MSVTVPVTLRFSGAIAGFRSESRRVQQRLAAVAASVAALALVLPWAGKASQAAENPPPQPGQIEETNLQMLLRSASQIQEQLQATHLALEQNRQEARQAAAQNAEALSNGLQVLQQTFSAQRAQETEARQRSDQARQRTNKVMLVWAGTFAGLGVAALVLLTFFQRGAAKQLAEISNALPLRLGPGRAAEVIALGPGDWRLAPGGRADQPNVRLLGAIEQLDKRLLEFRGTISPNGNGDAAVAPQAGPAKEPAETQGNARIPGLLNRAHSMLNLGQPDAALVCFDEVLSLVPDHAEALVRKGAALERLQRLNEAIACYDRAIAADGSLTIAYLHKGGLCNRLERFKEALECYEKALRTHDQREG